MDHVIFLLVSQNACEILTERLEPYKTAAPEDGWDKWVGAEVWKVASRFKCVIQK